MFTFTSSETRDDGRFTRQFFRCTRDISATVDWLSFLGAIVSLRSDNCTACRGAMETRFGGHLKLDAALAGDGAGALACAEASVPGEKLQPRWGAQVHQSQN